VEALRLYPQPPLLIRRSLKSDVLPGINFYRILNKDGIETNFIIVIVIYLKMFYQVSISTEYSTKMELKQILLLLLLFA